MVTAPYILKKPTIMSWLRNASLGGNYVKHRVISSNNKDFDPEACYESFRKHWQQIDDIINNTTVSKLVLSMFILKSVLNEFILFDARI